MPRGKGSESLATRPVTQVMHFVGRAISKAVITMLACSRKEPRGRRGNGRRNDWWSHCHLYCLKMTRGETATKFHCLRPCSTQIISEFVTTFWTLNWISITWNQDFLSLHNFHPWTHWLSWTWPIDLCLICQARLINDTKTQWVNSSLPPNNDSNALLHSI